MTVSSTTAKVSYSGNGSTTAFTVSFYFLATSDLKVTLRKADGTEVVKTISTDYTVTGAGVSSGGTVTMGTAPASGETLVIQRNVPLTQLVDYQPNDPFPANTHEQALDKLTMEIQQLNEALARAIKVSTTNTITSVEFTVDATTRALKVLGFDAAGELSVTQELGTFKGNWASGSSYKQRDLIKDTSNGNIYICATAHTSSGAQPISTNTDSAKWSLIVDAASATSSASAASTSATAAATSATAAATSATNAATSASSASTYATNASTSASAASTSASNAATSATAATTNGAAQVTLAAAQVTLATTQATNAATSATNAASSATSASSSAAAAAASAASGLYSAVQDKSANYTVVVGDAGDLLRVSTGSGAVTITLPQISTVSDGFKIAIVKWTGDANGVTINRSGSDTINGATSSTIGSQYSQTTFVADFETNQWFAASSGLGSTNVTVDNFSGSGGTTFTLSGDPGTKNNTWVEVSGVYQNKSTYSVSGTTLTFSTAPPSGTGNIEVVWTQPLSVGVPSDGTVTAAKMASGAALGNIGAGGMDASYLNANSQYMGFKNRIINGAMTVSQRGTSITLPAGGAATYALDRWRGNAPTSQNATVTQSSNAPTGFNYSYLYTVGTGSTNTGDQAETVQFIEGYNFADFGFGASGASTFTISFWVKSSITGSYGIAFENIDSTRTYSTTYTISSANTWEQKTLTIAGDTTGTWDKTTGRGLNIFFDLGHGTAQSQNATNAWANSGGTGTYRGVNGVVKLTQTTGATWQITGVQLEKGSTATSFDYRPYGTELQLCQRYFEKPTWQNGENICMAFANSGSLTQTLGTFNFLVQKRATPTVTVDTAASTFKFAWLNNSISGTSFLGNGSSLNTGTVLVGLGSNAGQIAGYYVSNGVSSISFSAEL